MVNRKLFATSTVPQPDVETHQGGTGFSQSAEHELAQFAVSGLFNDGYYEKAEDKIKRVLAICDRTSEEFVANCAVFGATHGWMRDAPCFLLAWLCMKRSPYQPQVARSVIRSSRTLRTFVQIVRSGKLGGHKSFTKTIQRYAKNFITRATPSQFIAATVGTPSMADLLRMFHPTPSSNVQSAMFGWATGTLPNAKFDELPREVQEFILFSRAEDPSELPVPDVPFQMLTNTKMSAKQWYEKAMQMPWQALRSNLITLDRRGVFRIDGAAEAIGNRLRDESLVLKAQVFPVQIFNAWKMVRQKGLPLEIQAGLQDAMDISFKLSATFDAKSTLILVDVSGSMGNDYRSMRQQEAPNIEFAAPIAVAAAMSSRSIEVVIGCFDDVVREIPVPGRALPGINQIVGMVRGGTNTAGALKAGLQTRTRGSADLLLLFTDEQEGDFYDGNAYSVIRSHLKSRPEAKCVIFQFGAYSASNVPENDREFIQTRILKVPGNNMNALKTAIEWHRNGGDFVSRVWGNVSSTPAPYGPPATDGEESEEG